MRPWLSDGESAGKRAGADDARQRCERTVPGEGASAACFQRAGSTCKADGGGRLDGNGNARACGDDSGHGRGNDSENRP